MGDKGREEEGGYTIERALFIQTRNGEVNQRREGKTSAEGIEGERTWREEREGMVSGGQMEGERELSEDRIFRREGRDPITWE